MSSTWKKHNKNRRSNRVRNGDRRYTVRGVRRDPVDISKLSKALLGLVVAEVERQAQAEHTQRQAGEVDPEVAAVDEPRSEDVPDA